ncbi:MAG: hypothetical protein KBC38_03340 [Candidatus Pacebacteria bacterium]|nr:hypothetical protein [Candidatus Paceibacterota bacterium]MBP9840789.1 hypothetical protein [Candidatus Paceibacterota bacterium]
MRIVTILLALLFFAALGIDVSQARDLGNPFHKGVSSPQQLADIIRANLALDSSGESMLSPERCATAGDRSCAAPIDYLEAFRLADPGAADQLRSVSDVPDYLDGLVPVAAPGGRYRSAWLKPTTTRKSGWKAEFGGLERRFHRGESAYKNPRTDKIVLMGDCTNPVGEPERPQIVCAYIMLRVDTDDRSLRVAEYSKNGRRLVDRDCNPAIRQVGSDSWESPWFEHCPRFDCTFAGADRTLGGYGYQRTRKGSFALGEAGWVVLRVPVHVTENGSAYAYNFCIDSYIYGDSCGITAVPGDYYTSHVAVIGYRSGEYPDTHPTGRRFAWHGNVGVWDFRHRNCP